MSTTFSRTKSKRPPRDLSVKGSVAESFAFGRDGTRLYVRERVGVSGGEHGLPGDEPTLILSDGLACDGYIWKYLWDDIPAQFPVVHWHYRGHGRSASPRDPDFVDIVAHASDLNAIRHHVGDRPVVLVGHSMGCQVALEAYRLRPSGVRALILLCGSSGRITQTFHGKNWLAQILPRLMRATDARPGLVRALWSRIPSRFALRVALLSGEVDKSLLFPEDLLPYLEHVTHLDFPMFLKMLRAAGDHSAEDLLPTIGVPVLVIAGDSDTFTPARLAEEMAKSVPQGEFALLRGGTHVVPLEQRDEVAALVRRFLCSLIGVSRPFT